jgi:hypothetical protein
MSNFVFRDENESFRPRVVSADANAQRREIAASVLPKGAHLLPKTAGGFFGGNMPMGVQPMGGGGGGSASYHMQRPYFPGTESPDRVQYPKSRAEANKAWRLFNESDPILGTAIDMYSEMLVSDFDLVVGDEKSREIRDTLEYMCQVSKLQESLRYIIKEFLVMGEALPHNFFDDKLGIWTYTAFHDPDNVDVLDSPMINADPILSLTPDEELRQLMVDNSPEARELRSRLPQEFVSKILARQRIRLSPLNCTFIPRKLHPYQTRGTSLVSRMWRIFMVEDAVYNSTIATFRRHAAPVKVVKLGNAATGWMPGPGAETKVLEMLNRAETDPHCFVPETLVTRSDGMLTPIGELKIGDELLDKYGKVCRVEVLQEEFSDTICEFKISGMFDTIKCTPNHKFDIWGAPRGFCRDNRCRSKVNRLVVEKGRTPYQKVMASELVPGDFLMIPRTFDEVPSEISESQARLLGYYAAEGNTREVYVRQDESVRMGLEFSFCEDETDTWAKDCGEIISELCGYDPGTYPVPERHACQVRVNRNSSSDLAHWVKSQVQGDRAPLKCLSKEVMGWPLNLKEEFIKGYVRGDGGMVMDSSNPYVELCSSSRNLLEQVRLIMFQLGYFGNLSKRVQSKASYGPGNLQYRLHFCGAQVQRMASVIFGMEVDAPLTDECRWWMDDNFVYVPVSQKIVHEGVNQAVVNMTVSGDHSYCVHHIGTRNSWLVYNYGIEFEAWGTTDKAISISKEHEVIERVKLLALGLSKSFMTGEVTYASAKSGLQVFLRRLLSLRQFLENIWLYPKFFRPISEINEWTTSSPSEINHKYRLKRTAQEIQEQNLILMPTIKWKNKLDPSVDQDLLNAYQMLEKMGVKLSKATISSAVGVDWQDELDLSLKEFTTAEKMKADVLGAAGLDKYNKAQGQGQQQAPAPPGAPGSGAKPPSAGGAPPGGAKPPGGGMDDASKPPGSGAAPGGGLEAIQSPSGGGLPTGVE